MKNATIEKIGSTVVFVVALLSLFAAIFLSYSHATSMLEDGRKLREKRMNTPTDQVVAAQLCLMQHLPTDCVKR